MSRQFSFALFACVLLAAGCDRSQTPVAPTRPPEITPAPSPGPPSSSLANWKADATVVAVSRGSATACGWGTTTGETRAAVEWRITIEGAAITADEDMRNWPTDDVPFSGTLDGLQFTAAYASAPDYLRYVCQFRGGTLSGSFNADFTTFEATETLVWGPPGGETTVQRRWVGSKL